MDIFELYIIAAAGAEFVPAPLSIHISITYISYIHIIYIIYIYIYNKYMYINTYIYI